MSPYDTNYVKKIVKKRGWFVLKNFEYKTMKTSFRLKCKTCGTKWNSTLDRIIHQNQGCPNCALKNRRKPEKEVKKLIESKGWFLDKTWKYEHSNKNFKVTCEKGHHWKTNWNRIQQGHGCPFCKNVAINEQDIKQFIKIKKGKVTKNWTYKNAVSEFKIKCNKGHTWKTTWNRIKSGHWCPYCSKCKINPNKIKKFITDKGGKLKDSWRYINSTKKFYVTCEHKHQWKTNWTMLQQGHWCPHCHNKTEQKFRKVIEKFLNARFPTKFLEFLRYPETGYKLELDGYNKELKIAFEYQGQQHYELCYLNNYSKNRLKEIQKRDAFKVKKCKEKGILLIVVPYWIPKEKWIIGIKNKVNSFLTQN